MWVTGNTKWLNKSDLRANFAYWLGVVLQQYEVLQKITTTSGHKISVKRRSFNCAVLPSSKEKPLPNVVLGRVSLTVFSYHVRLRLLVWCFLIRRLLAATIGTVHGLSVDVFAFQFYHASVYQSIEETSHTHNLCTPFQWFKWLYFWDPFLISGIIIHFPWKEYKSQILWISHNASVIILCRLHSVAWHLVHN